MSKPKAEHELDVKGRLTSQWMETAQDETIETEELATTYQQRRVLLNELVKAAEKERKKNADPAYKAWRDINAMWKERKAPFEKAVRLVDAKLRDWKQLQAARVAEAQAEAQEAARRAMEARAAGDEETAAEEFEAAHEAIVTVSKPAEKVEGFREVERWVMEVTDPVAFLQFVALSDDWQDYVTVNQSALDRVAREIRVEGPVKFSPGLAVKKVVGFAS